MCKKLFIPLSVLPFLLLLNACTPLVLGENGANKLVFFTQNTLPDSELSNYLLSNYRVSSHVTLHSNWIISPHLVRSDDPSTPIREDLQDFIGTNDESDRAHMKQYLIDQRPVPLPNTPKDHLLLDIEQGFAPVQYQHYFDDLSDTERSMFLYKLKLRIDYARVLFPKAKLGLYGYAQPSGSQITTESLENQMRILRAVAAAGVLDAIDYVWVVVYQRFGPTDVNYKNIPLYTEAALRQTLTLRRTDGTAPKVGVLYSQKVYNGSTQTAHHYEVHVEAVRLQRAVVKNFFPGVLEGVWDKDGLDASQVWWEQLFAD